MSIVANTFSEVQNVGQLIRDIRKTRGISVNELAQVTGLACSVISKFERGKTDIQFSSMIKILSAMSLTLEDLCHSAVFDEFLINELVEKAYQFKNDPVMLKNILDEIQQRDMLLRQERVFKLILIMRINTSQLCPIEVNDYFDNLEELLTFDAYLALLAEPFLSRRIGLRIAKAVSRYQGQHPQIMAAVFDAFVDRIV